MQVLIVEDNQERIQWFRKEFDDPNITLHIAEDSRTANVLINTIVFDVIFLDHDLGNRIFVPSEDENTGYCVAKKLQESRNKDTRVIVHSYNPAGVERIKGRLPKAVARPFGTFDKTILFGESEAQKILRSQIRIFPTKKPT